VSVGNRFNCPHPIEASIPIVVPASATALRYLCAPKIVIAWNCENKCDCSRHDHSAQNTNEKYPNHLVFPHFPHSISKVAITPVLYLALSIRSGFGARHFWLNPFRRFVSFLFGNHE
jgi:hypothetical protein